MKIVKLIRQDDKSFAWIDGERKLGTVNLVDGLWHVAWYKLGSMPFLFDTFSTAHAACLAAEKYWPVSGQLFMGWLESAKGGYFRKFGNRRTAYVRQAPEGWYAVQMDGKVLGKGGKMSWFATAEVACQAVEAELYTPVDRDPFTGPRGELQWMKLRNSDLAA